MLLPLSTREQAEAVYSEVLAGLLTTERSCRESNDVRAIPLLFSRIADLNAVEEKMRPHVESRAFESGRQPAGGPKKAPAGNR